MTSVVDQLLEMGFTRERAELAVKEIGEAAGLETAMDWLVSHEEAAEGSAEKTEETPLAVGSYKCNDCGKIMKDENAMMFHASKTGHTDFAESTENIKPLTEEEKKEQAAKLKERIKASMAAKAEAEKLEELEKEKRRMVEGKKMLEVREKQKEREQLEAIAARKREKEEEVTARKRVLDQIKADKEARAAAAAGHSKFSAPPPPTHSHAPPQPLAPPKNYDQTTIQVRLPDGQALRQTFGANEELSAVRLWLRLQRPDLGNFDLLVPFPRKLFTDVDFAAPLSSHGLVPSGSLVVTRSP